LGGTTPKERLEAGIQRIQDAKMRLEKQNGVQLNSGVYRKETIAALSNKRSLVNLHDPKLPANKDLDLGDANAETAAKQVMQRITSNVRIYFISKYDLFFKMWCCHNIIYFTYLPYFLDSWRIE
jgi:hypothetical protein